jgi:hypothetical protein
MLTRVTSGKIQHRDFTVDQSCPSWLTPELNGGGAISYGATGATFETLAAADRAYLVNTNNSLIPKNTPHVIRVKAQITADVNNNMIFPILVVNAATTPTGSISVSSAYVYPRVDFYRSTGTGRIFEAAYLSSTGGLTAAYSLATDYCFSVTRGTADTQLHVYSNNYAALLDTSVAWANLAFLNYPWLCIGDVSSAYYGTMVVAYVQLMRSTDITVTGLPTGSTVRLYDSAGTLIASAVSAGGTATLELAGVAGFDTNSNPDTADGGFFGTIKVFADSSYTIVLDVTSFEDMWGGDEYEYEAPTPIPEPVARATVSREPRGMYVLVQDRTGDEALSQLTERMPEQQPSVNLFEGMSFESCNPGGFTTASFTLHRPVTQYWADLLPRNRIVIGESAQVFWEGYIDKAPRSIRPDIFDVSCQGWSARLNELWTTADITVVAATDHMNEFISNVVLADAELSTYSEIVAGTIETGDYDFPDGTRFEFAPATYYFDALEQMNAANNYDWGVWLDHKFYFTAKTPTIIKWYVKTEDCDDLTISQNVEALCNYVLVNYTQDGSHYQQVTVQDADSQALYGVIKKKIDVPGRITTAGATQIGNTYIAECKDLKVSAEFTCNRIFDAYGSEHSLGEARGGDNIRIADWLPTEETLITVNDIATFQIKSVKYNHDDYTLDVTPTEFLPSTDIQIARLQAVGY